MLIFLIFPLIIIVIIIFRVFFLSLFTFPLPISTSHFALVSNNYFKNFNKHKYYVHDIYYIIWFRILDQWEPVVFHRIHSVAEANIPRNSNTRQIHFIPLQTVWQYSISLEPIIEISKRSTYNIILLCEDCVSYSRRNISFIYFFFLPKRGDCYNIIKICKSRCFVFIWRRLKKKKLRKLIRN